jgi:hypothetical protein
VSSEFGADGGVEPAFRAVPGANPGYGVLQGLLLQQANLRAYVDTFCWTALILALCLPAAWMLKKAAAKGGPVLH